MRIQHTSPISAIVIRKECRARSRIGCDRRQVFRRLALLIMHIVQWLRRNPKRFSGPPTRAAHSQYLRQPQLLRLPPVEHRRDDVRRQAGERQKPADVGVRDHAAGFGSASSPRCNCVHRISPRSGAGVRARASLPQRLAFEARTSATRYRRNLGNPGSSQASRSGGGFNL
jgi:hypothetical protein